MSLILVPVSFATAFASASESERAVKARWLVIVALSIVFGATRFGSPVAGRRTTLRTTGATTLAIAFSTSGILCSALNSWLSMFLYAEPSSASGSGWPSGFALCAGAGSICRPAGLVSYIMLVSAMPAPPSTAAWWILV